MTISAHGTSSSIALTKPSYISVHARSIVCRSGSGIARRKAATVSFLRSASTARISTPPPASGTVTSATKSRCPRLSAISSRPITPSRSQASQSTARSIQRSRMPSIVSSETPSLRAASATVELINMRKAHGSYAFVLGLRGSYHAHRCVVVGCARTVRASIPFGPNLDEDGHVEQRQMAKAHDRIQPVQVANLPTAAAAPGPFEGALDADEPVPLLGPLRREDANIGQVQRHLNDSCP